MSPEAKAQEELDRAAMRQRELEQEERFVGTELFLAAHPDIARERESERKKADGRKFEVIEPSYLYRRIYKEMNVTDEDITIPLSFSNHDGMSQTLPRKIFTMAEDGGIDILVYDINGNVIEYTKQEPTKTEQQSSLDLQVEYVVHRYSPEYIQQWEANHRGQELHKYMFPSKKKTGDCGTFPFFPPKLLAKYKEGIEIPTLVLTEGYFKAMCGSLHGADIVGLGSITLFEEKKNAQLYPDIIRIITKCKVKNIVILYDGDALNISRQKLEEMKRPGASAQELTGRPRQFAAALDKLRRLIQRNFSKLEIYFAMVNTDNLHGNPKGFDDLLCSPHFRNVDNEIVDELNDVTAPSLYLMKYNIKSNTNVDRYFYINSVKDFYDRHSEEIGNCRFKYMGTVYRYDEGQKQPVKVGSYDINDVVRVDGKFYLETRIPSFRDLEGRITLKPISRQDIMDDYGSEAPRKLIHRKYISFVNIPSHTHFQQVIGNCWNRYSRLSYEPEKDGSWLHIDALLHHIFDSSGMYELALDYLTIMYQKPEQQLPILCLVSREGSTGKTTFLKLLEAMFEENAAVDLSDAELSAQFNTVTSGKLVIGIDETAVGDNKRITEVLKRISTSDVTYTEAKGVDKVKEDSFTKIVLCSNSETHFAHIKPDEQRFWIIRVPVLSKEEREGTPNLKAYLKQEVPAFVGFLNARGVQSRNVSRMWFSWSQYHTEAFDKLISEQMPKNMRAVRDYVTPIFKEKVLDELLYDVRFIEYELGNKLDRGTDIERLLGENFGLKKFERKDGKGEITNRTSTAIPFWHIDNTGNIILGPSDPKDTSGNYKRYCRPYVFPAKVFLSEDEYTELQRKLDLRKQQNATQSELSFTPEAGTGTMDPDASASDEEDCPF